MADATRLLRGICIVRCHRFPSPARLPSKRRKGNGVSNVGEIMKRAAQRFGGPGRALVGVHVGDVLGPVAGGRLPSSPPP